MDEFDEYGATRCALRQFCAACGDLNAFERQAMLPDPDRRTAA